MVTIVNIVRILRSFMEIINVVEVCPITRLPLVICQQDERQEWEEERSLFIR